MPSCVYLETCEDIPSAVGSCPEAEATQLVISRTGDVRRLVEGAPFIGGRVLAQAALHSRRGEPGALRVRLAEPQEPDSKSMCRGPRSHQAQRQADFVCGDGSQDRRCLAGRRWLLTAARGGPRVLGVV